MSSENEEILLPTGSLGYAIKKENRADLEKNGIDSKLLLAQYRDAFPVFDTTANPLGAIDILNQGNQGACQGHALALIFSICFFLATGRRQKFSRAAGYYLSQRYDGIRGDNGSTLSGGRKVATEHGMCLESDWPYPSRYNPTEPANVPYLYTLKTTKPMTSVKDVTDWIDAGLPVQQGGPWNDSTAREIVSNWRSGGGGHSTVFWQRSQRGNIVMPNSWGADWNDDGMNEWTEASIAAALKDRYTVMIGYAPDGMSFPDQSPLS
jgi:hypothetical protein